METSLAMVPTRVKARGSFSRDHPATLARTSCAGRWATILALQVLKRGPDLLYNHGIPDFACSFCLSVPQPVQAWRLL